MWAGINDVTKYVLSISLIHSDWQNSVFLNKVDEVRKLKASEGGNIKVHSSAHLLQTLFQHDLVDEICLMTFLSFWVQVNLYLLRVKVLLLLN